MRIFSTLRAKFFASPVLAEAIDLSADSQTRAGMSKEDYIDRYEKAYWGDGKPNPYARANAASRWKKGEATGSPKNDSESDKAFAYSRSGFSPDD